MMAAMHMPTPAPAQIVLTGQDLDLSVADIPRRDLTAEFFATVVFPILLALVLSILLSIFFFCSRQGSERRDELTSETQLSQYNTIRRATTNLRLMSQRRDGPPPLSPSPRHSKRTPVTPPTSTQRRHVANQQPAPQQQQVPPPPYRLPPSYPTTNMTVVTNSANASPVEPAAGPSPPVARFLEEPTTSDGMNLVSQTSSPGSRPDSDIISAAN